MTDFDAPPKGRHSGAADDVDVLRAVIFLLSERGYGGVTMPAIAKEVGISLATLSQRYPDRDAAVIAALHLQVPQLRIPDTGGLASDIRAWLGFLNDRLLQPRRTRVIATLLDEATRNPAIATAIQDGMTAQVRAELRSMFERAAARGEMRPGIDLDVAIDLAVGPIFLRQLESYRPTGDDFIDELAALVVTAVSCAP